MVQGSEDANEPDGGPEFAQVFVIVWLGAAVVTMNTKLLGGTMYVSLYIILSLLWEKAVYFE